MGGRGVQPNSKIVEVLLFLDLFHMQQLSHGCPKQDGGEGSRPLLENVKEKAVFLCSLLALLTLITLQSLLPQLTLLKIINTSNTT